jgi:hypothetical protein
MCSRTGFLLRAAVYGRPMMRHNVAMVSRILFYVGSAVPFLWGATHLVFTRSVVQGFGQISQDNRRIITMEWITEGVALIFIAAVVFLVTVLDHRSAISKAVYWASFATLNVLSVVSLFTGFQIHFLPFRLCPVIFTGSSILILIGTLI